MRMISRCLVFAVVLFAASGAVFAQQENKPPSPPSAEEIVSRMKTELGLTDEQVNQITPVIQEEAGRMQEMMEEGVSPEPGQTDEKIEQLRRDTESKLAQYLMESQLAQWKKDKKQPPQAGEKGRMPPSGEGPGGGGFGLSGDTPQE